MIIKAKLMIVALLVLISLNLYNATNDHNKSVVCYTSAKKRSETINRNPDPQLAELCTHIVYGDVTYHINSFDFRIINSFRPLPKSDIKKLKNGNKLKVVLGVKPPSSILGYGITRKLPDTMKWIEFLKKYGFDGVFIEYIGDLPNHHFYMTKLLNHLHYDFQNNDLLLMAEDRTCSEYPFDKFGTELEADLLISSCKNLFVSNPRKVRINGGKIRDQFVIEQPKTISGFSTSKIIGLIDFVITMTTINRVDLKSIYNCHCNLNVLNNLLAGDKKCSKREMPFRTLYGVEMIDCYDDKTIKTKVMSSILNGLGGIFVTLANGYTALRDEDIFLLQSINTGISLALEKNMEANEISDFNIEIDVKMNDIAEENSMNINHESNGTDNNYVGKKIFREGMMIVAIIIYFGLTG